MKKKTIGILFILIASAYLILMVYLDTYLQKKNQEILVRNCTPRPMKSMILQANQESSGAFLFFMASYSSEQEEYYYFYAKEPISGGYKLEKKHISQVVIFEDEKNSPYALYRCNSQKWFLHIPPNSIETTFSIDLEKDLK